MGLASALISKFLYVVPHFNKNVYIPSESGNVYFSIANKSKLYFYISNIHLEPSWKSQPSQLSKQIPPSQTLYTGAIDFSIPSSITGKRLFSLVADGFIYSFTNKEWRPFPKIKLSSFFCQIIPLPYYKAFISRSNRDEDRPIIEPIVDMIRNWGFAVETVGINTFAKDPRNIDRDIFTKIKEADCVIAIATVRDIGYKTFEWLNSEATMAAVIQKPTLIIMDEMVNLEGLPSLDKIPKITFSLSDIGFGSLRDKIDSIMPDLRAFIRGKQVKDNQKFMRRLVLKTIEDPEMARLLLALGKES